MVDPFEPARRRRKREGAPPPLPGGYLRAAVGVVAVLVGGAWIASALPDSGPGATVGLNPRSSRAVTYRVTGTARSASITYATPAGIRQEEDVEIPLRRAGDGGEGIHLTVAVGDALSLRVRNRHETGSVTCAIEVDGVVVDTDTSSGAYAIARCAASG